MGSPKTPQDPNPSETYKQGILTNIKYAPDVAAAEYKLRGEYDDKSVEDNLSRQQKYGGAALDMYQSYLKDIDPQGQAVRSQLGAAVSRDLAAGSKLGPGLSREYEQAIREAEVARGNTSGNSAISAEALNQGSAAQALYQQRLANAGTFLAGDSSVRDLTSVAGLTTAAVQPDRSFNYVNPLSGQQGQNVALQYYQSALQGGAAGGGNPWVSALAGVGGQVAGAAASSAISSAIRGATSSGGGSYLGSYTGPE